MSKEEIEMKMRESSREFENMNDHIQLSNSNRMNNYLHPDSKFHTCFSDIFISLMLFRLNNFKKLLNSYLGSSMAIPDEFSHGSQMKSYENQDSKGNNNFYEENNNSCESYRQPYNFDLSQQRKKNMIIIYL